MAMATQRHETTATPSSSVITDDKQHQASAPTPRPRRQYTRHLACVTHFEGIKQQWQKKSPLSKWQWQEHNRNSVNEHCNGIAVQLLMSKTKWKF